MRLVSIEVDGLFGMFDHRLPLSDERVSIVIAPNGYGKSRMLGIAHAMMALDLGTLLETDFSQARLTMNDGSWLTAIRECPAKDVVVRFKFAHQGEEGLFDTAPLLADMDESDRKLRAEVSELARLDEGGRVPKYLDRSHGIEMSFVQALLRYQDRFNDGLEERLPPQALIGLIDSLPIVRVSTQRTLQHECACPVDGEPGLLYTYIFTPTVRDMSEEVSKTIKVARMEGGTLLAEAEGQALAGLLEALVEGRCSGGDEIGLKDRLMKVRHRIGRSMSMGLIDAFQPEIPTSGIKMDDQAVCAIDLYLDRLEPIMERFDFLTLRLETLLETVNSMLLFKRAWVDESGFRVEMDNGRILSIEELSAGEQQLLIMLYSLMFRTLPGSVAIIDEPEISLHVAWQQRMVPILMNVADLMDIQVILATHSPQIVHDRWDLTVQLGE